MPLTRDLGLVLLSAFLLVLSFPSPASPLIARVLALAHGNATDLPAGSVASTALRPLAWVAFVPALFALARRGSLKRAFFLGWVWSFAFFLGGIYWIVFTLRVYGHLPLWVGVLALVLLSSALAVFQAVFVVIARRGYDLLRGPAYAVLLAAAWVMTEHARSFVLSGFPWMSLGYCQAGNLALIQFADIAGFYGVSALLVLGNAVLFDLARPPPAARTRSKTWIIADGAVLIVAIAAALSYGTVRMLRLPGHDTGERMHVALLQGNIDQDKKWDVRFQNETIDTYEALAREGAPPGTDLIVLPETAAPFFFQEGGPLAERIRALAREKGMHLLFGAPAYRAREAGVFESRNRAYLLDPQGDEAATYDKLHLVPFGEYSPVPFLAKVVPGQGDFRPGEGPVVFAHPKGRFGVLICYEAIFPDLTRRFVRDGAEFLVNITNDAWFGRTSSPRQHLEMATFRAIENRVTVVRAANTGITAVIDPWGRVEKATGIFEKASLAAEIRPRAGGSFYSRHGDVFAWSCWIVTLGLLAYGVWRRGAGREASREEMLPLVDPF